MEDSFLQKTIRWITHSPTLNKIKSRFQSQNHHNNQGHHQILAFPSLNHNPEQAKAYSLQHIRKGLHKNKTASQIEKQVHLRIKKTSRYWGNRLKIEQKPMQLTCPICIELMVCPVSTSCGHAFCWQCIDQALLINSCCPVCRCQIRGHELIRCLQLSAMTSVFIKKWQCLDNESYQICYNQRLIEFDNWLKLRKINVSKAKPSDLIDAQDTEFIWCTAVIKQIININSSVAFLIHYIGWNNVYDEIIPADSQRLANYKFYTGRKNIARYQIIESQSQLQGYVVGSEETYENQEVNSQQNADEDELEFISNSESSQQNNISQDMSSHRFLFTRPMLHISEEIMDDNQKSS